MIDSTLKVYQMFGDDCSKEIYGQRLLYSLTNDDKYIQKLVNYLEPIRWLRDKLKGISSPNVLLYGAGFRGKRLSWICPDLFRGFVDEDLDPELLVKRNEKVTFIKMDIEGAELETLKGASRLIAEQKPKLAVCVYHKPEDIFTIPEFENIKS